MRGSVVGVIALMAGLALAPAPVRAIGGQDDHGHNGSKSPERVTVAFGAGLNTPGSANHHVLPNTIEIGQNGVVSFLVSGFHQIFVYMPGITPEEVLAHAPAFPGAGVTPANLFINYGFPIDPVNPKLFYAGINPGFTAANLPPLNPAQPPAPPFVTNTFNRVESIAFPNLGTYLVICNINPHFRDGMYAWVNVNK